MKLTEISRAKKCNLVTAVNNYEEADSSFGYYSHVNVRVYETVTRYHYEVRIIDKDHMKLSCKRTYSSSKDCNSHTVARKLIKKYEL